MKVSFKYKLFLAFVLYGFVLMFFTQLIIFMINESRVKEESIKKASEVFTNKKALFNQYIENIKYKLVSVDNSDVFHKYLDAKVSRDTVESLFIDIASTSANIMQLRYIDNNGMEVVRIDRDNISSLAYKIDRDKLQDKSKRYYFKDILKTPKNKFWYSNIDLNIERGVIEKPIKPVLRIGIPVFYKGEKRGVLIINIFMKTFLESLSESTLFDIYLVDSDGKILIDSINNHCWHKYLKPVKQECNLEGIYNIKEVLNNDEYYGEELYARKIFFNNYENVYMIIKPKSDYLNKEVSEHLYHLLWVMLAVVSLSFPIAYFFSRTPSRLKEQVESHNNEQNILLSLFGLGDAVLFKWNYDEHWSVNHVTDGVNKLLEYSQSEFVNNKILYASCVHPEDLERVKGEVTKAIDSEVFFFEHKPYRIVTKSGKIKWILDNTVVVRNEKDEIVNFIGYLTDITKLKKSEIEFKSLSTKDQLTKLSNRRKLDEILKNQNYRFARDGELCSIVLVDIDFFKSVNDDYGHIVGDKVLIEFAHILKSSIREGDFLGRWGGEEFLIILPHTTLTQAVALANKIREKITLYKFTTVIHKTASFGVSTFDENITIEKLLDNADKALYKSKNDGRNKVSTI